jgi:hypothetical protein
MSIRSGAKAMSNKEREKKMRRRQRNMEIVPYQTQRRAG